MFRYCIAFVLLMALMALFVEGESRADWVDHGDGLCSLSTREGISESAAGCFFKECVPLVTDCGWLKSCKDFCCQIDLGK